MRLTFQVDMDDVLAELDRLSAGPDTAKFEGALLQGYLVVAEHVHVLTGGLKGSGYTGSTVGDDQWEGWINYDRYPGIYELARGDAPTANHPEGGHHFYDPGGQTFVDAVKKVLQDFVEGG